MCFGFHPTEEGRIFLVTKTNQELSPEKRGIGLVFQNYALYPHMTGAKEGHAFNFPLQKKI